MSLENHFPTRLSAASCVTNTDVRYCCISHLCCWGLYLVPEILYHSRRISVAVKRETVGERERGRVSG